MLAAHCYLDTCGKGIGFSLCAYLCCIRCCALPLADVDRAVAVMRVDVAGRRRGWSSIPPPRRRLPAPKGSIAGAKLSKARGMSVALVAGPSGCHPEGARGVDENRRRVSRCPPG